MDIRKINLIMICIAVMVLFSAHFVYAGEKKTDLKTISSVQTVEGQVSGMTKRSISISYLIDKNKGEEYEILLPFAPEGVSVEHKNSLSEISTGDTVKVSYIETIQEDDKGNKKEERKATAVSFIKQSQSQAGALVSDEPLSLKGTK